MRKILMMAAMAALAVCGCDSNDRESDVAEKSGKSSSLIREVKSQKAKKAKSSAKKKLSKKERKARKEQRRKKALQARAEAIRKAFETPPEGLSAEDKKTFENLRQALGNENYTGVRDAAAAAQKSPNAELRSQAVHALSWFGAKGMGTLTGYLYDADEGVAQDAQMAWESGLMEIEDQATKLAYIEAAMKSIDNEEMLDAISQNYNQVEDSAAAVESMLRVIGNGGKGATKAQEAYAFLTGEEWTDQNAARTWVAQQRADAAAEAAESGVSAEAE